MTGCSTAFSLRPAGGGPCRSLPSNRESGSCSWASAPGPTCPSCRPGSVPSASISAPTCWRAQAKLPLVGRDVTLVQGDAQALPPGLEGFDAAVLHLVLSVVPDGTACLHETLRALRPGGRAVIFDKFAPDGGRLTLGRRLVNLVTTLAGTDITRRFGDMAAQSDCVKVHDEPSLLRGAYRVILIQKPNCQGDSA